MGDKNDKAEFLATFAEAAGAMTADVLNGLSDE
jgi:hypothetical protein